MITGQYLPNIPYLLMPNMTKVQSPNPYSRDESPAVDVGWGLPALSWGRGFAIQPSIE